MSNKTRNLFYVDILVDKRKWFWFAYLLSCSSNSLKFIDFLIILGGVPVFNLPIENFNLSIDFAKFIEGLSPTLPAGKLSVPIRIIPLKKVPVVKQGLYNKFYHIFLI